MTRHCLCSGLAVDGWVDPPDPSSGGQTSPFNVTSLLAKMKDPEEYCSPTAPSLYGVLTKRGEQLSCPDNKNTFHNDDMVPA